MDQITAEKALELWTNYKNDFFKSMKDFEKPPSSIHSFNKIKRAKTQGCMAGMVLSIIIAFFLWLFLMDKYVKSKTEQKKPVADWIPIAITLGCICFAAVFCFPLGFGIIDLQNKAVVKIKQSFERNRIRDVWSQHPQVIVDNKFDDGKDTNYVLYIKVKEGWDEKEN